MPLTDLHKVLDEIHCEAVVKKAFVDVWSLVEVILDSFASAMRLPIFVYLHGTNIFTSTLETMPPFCRAMLSNPTCASLCYSDGAARSQDASTDEIHLCHAGLVNGRVSISNTHVGEIVILYGSKVTSTLPAVERRSQLLQRIKSHDAEAGHVLESALQSGDGPTEIGIQSTNLMKAIGRIVQQLLEATVTSQSLAISMAHELSQMLLSLGLYARQLREALPRNLDGESAPLINEARLGLFVVHNFLSHLSEQRYMQVVKAALVPLDLGAIVREMVDLYEPQAQRKGAQFEILGLDYLTSPIKGHDLEIRRAIHNILNNALKYSYHSVPEATRKIRIRAKVPYDPGFRQRRLAIQFENYGLGLTSEELKLALKPGFRGQQAASEVPIGSGIGLSEVVKIMKLHGGDVRIDSKALHAKEGTLTYLTRVDLIFPY